MINFKYVAKSSDGKTISGTLEANDRVSAIDTLRKKDLTIVFMEETLVTRKLPALNFFKKKINLDDLVVFSRQLATMVDAGIPLVGALDILSEQMENKQFAGVTTIIKKDVEAGLNFSDALSKHKAVFSSLFVSMVRAGETSGTLDEILDRLAAYLEKTSSLQKKIKSALVYPMVVSLMAVVITLFLLIYIIPVFKNIFSGFGAQLPTPTLVLIAISDFLKRYFWVAILILAGGIFAIARFVKTEKGRTLYDGVLLNMPIFGILFKKVAISKFTRTLSTLIKSGVPILASLDIVGKTAGNKVVELAVESVRNNVREGESVAEPLSRSKIFPPMVVRMVAVGEQAGQLEKMLGKIADFYDDQVDAAVSGLTSMIEPLIIAFLGLVIGSIVVCMFLPIFKIISVVGM